jgi:hypothetical protein
MAELTEKQATWLVGLRRGQRISSGLGIVLALLGAAYVAWAVKTFDPRVDPREQPAWDRPIAGLADLYRPYLPIIEAIKPKTDVEQILHEGVTRNLAFSTGVMILLVRVMIGSLVCVAGLAALTVVVERQRLLELIGQLETSEPAR